MKKKNLIALVIILTFALVGTAYAAWSGQLKISSNVKSAKFDVGFVTSATKLLASDTTYVGQGIAKYLLIRPIAKYTTASLVSNTKDTIAIKIDKLYPGSLALLAATIKNNGTIPVKFSDSVVSLTKSDELNNGLMCAGGYLKNLGFGGSGSFSNVKLSDLEAKLDTLLAGIVLKPNEFITLDIPEDKKAEIAAEVEAYDPENNCLLFYMPTSTTDCKGISEESFSIQLKWDQYIP